MNRADDLFSKLTTGGEGAIDELIVARKAEELFLDFKRSGDNGAGARLHDSDSKNFSKAISGFGNSEGGIILWGVDCSVGRDGADVATKKVPIKDAIGFASRLESAVSRSTTPAHSGVRNIAITQSGGTEGFVVSFVPKSNAAPLQVIGAMQYYMRAGSDFVPVPHSVLAGMFGRRPEPNVDVQQMITFPKITGDVLTFSIGMLVRNDGPGIARDIFLNLLCSSMPCAVGSVEIEAEDQKNWIAQKLLGVHLSIISQPTLRLAPGSYLVPVVCNFRISPPFLGDLDIKGTVGCEGGMPNSFRLYNKCPNVAKAYNLILKQKSLDPLDDRMLSVLLGLSEGEESELSPGK